MCGTFTSGGPLLFRALGSGRDRRRLDPFLAEHLQQVAKAGGTGKESFVPGDQVALAEALAEIVGADTSCLVPLAAGIDDAAGCRGAVQINGEAIACDEPDGFSIEDKSLLRLSGAACARYQEDRAELCVSMPCSSLDPL